MALTIFAIGAAGVMAMQRSVIQGNDDARRMDVATAIAREWTERLRRDATMWTLPNSANPSTNNLTNAPLFSKGGSTDPLDGAWHRPTQRLSDTVPMSPGFDLLGNDVPQTLLAKTNPSDGAPIFCTNVRLTVLVTNEVLRSEVRVFWPRNIDVKADDAFCNGDPTFTDPLTQATLSKYHFVYDVTSIRRNQTR